MKILFQAVIGLFILIISVSTTFAQEATDGQDNRFPGLPYYSYGSGLGWTTPDSTFQLNLRFRMQNRATFLNYEEEDPAIEAVVRRLRLRFDGFVGDPRFLYAIQLSFSPGDVGQIQEGRNINIIRDAVIFYRPNRFWNFGFGQTKLPGNRQRLNSSGALQLTDRSVNNATFNIDRDFGFQAFYLSDSSHNFSYNIKTAVSTGEGRNWTDSPSVNLAYTGRVELFPLGAFQKNGFFFEGDIVREETPKLLLAGTYHFNHKAQRTQGQLGRELIEPQDLTSIFVDAMLKYRGFSLQSAWMTRRTDFPISGPNIPFVIAGSGTDVQMSYLFPSDFEVIGRFSTQKPASEIANFQPERDQYSFGVTRYVWEHALKIQTELTYDIRSFSDNTTNNGWYFRFQVEIGI